MTDSEFESPWAEALSRGPAGPGGPGGRTRRVAGNPETTGPQALAFRDSDRGWSRARRPRPWGLNGTRPTMHPPAPRPARARGPGPGAGSPGAEQRRRRATVTGSRHIQAGGTHPDLFSLDLVSSSLILKLSSQNFAGRQTTRSTR